MPLMSEKQSKTRLTPFRQILRRIECVRGEVPVEVIYAPRPDYARVTPRLEQPSRLDRLRVESARAQPPLRRCVRDRGRDGDGRASRCTLARRARSPSATTIHAPAVFARGLDADQIDETVAYWAVSGHRSSNMTGPYRDLVMAQRGWC